METFGIRIYKEYFNFAAAHFLIFEDGTREELHGHNYQVQMMIEGMLGGDKDIFIDFLHIKPIVKAICDSIDHRTIFPDSNPYITVKSDGGSVEAVYHDGDRWVIPSRDVVILPIPNTSAERLAQYLCHQTLQALAEKYPDAAISRVEFAVEESRGQAAVYRMAFEAPKPLHELDFNRSLVAR